MYVTFVGQSNPEEARQVLQEINRRKTGSVATLTAGSVAMILPFGSHGVFVSYEASSQPRQLSTIRT